MFLEGDIIGLLWQTESGGRQNQIVLGDRIIFSRKKHMELRKFCMNIYIYVDAGLRLRSRARARDFFFFLILCDFKILIIFF